MILVSVILILMTLSAYSVFPVSVWYVLCANKLNKVIAMLFNILEHVHVNVAERSCNIRN